MIVVVPTLSTRELKRRLAFSRGKLCRSALEGEPQVEFDLAESAEQVDPSSNADLVCSKVAQKPTARQCVSNWNGRTCSCKASLQPHALEDLVETRVLAKTLSTWPVLAKYRELGIANLEGQVGESH